MRQASGQTRTLGFGVEVAVAAASTVETRAGETGPATHTCGSGDGLADRGGGPDVGCDRPDTAPLRRDRPAAAGPDRHQQSPLLRGTPTPEAPADPRTAGAGCRAAGDRPDPVRAGRRGGRLAKSPPAPPRGEGPDRRLGRHRLPHDRRTGAVQEGKPSHDHQPSGEPLRGCDARPLRGQHARLPRTRPNCATGWPARRGVPLLSGP